MCEFNAKRIVPFQEEDHDQFLKAQRASRLEGGSTLESDLRLRPDFVFWGKYFNGKARVVSVDLEERTLVVETYREYADGRQFSSVEHGWNLLHYLQGFLDLSYTPMKLLDENDPVLGDSHPLYFGLL